MLISQIKNILLGTWFNLFLLHKLFFVSYYTIMIRCPDRFHNIYVRAFYGFDFYIYVIVRSIEHASKCIGNKFKLSYI